MGKKKTQNTPPLPFPHPSEPGKLHSYYKTDLYCPPKFGGGVSYSLKNTLQMKKVVKRKYFAVVEEVKQKRVEALKDIKIDEFKNF